VKIPKLKLPDLSLLVVYLSIFAMVLINISYSTYAVRENGRKFCSIITTVNDAYSKDDPKTEIGVQLKKDYIQLERDLNCDR